MYETRSWGATPARNDKKKKNAVKHLIDLYNRNQDIDIKQIATQCQISEKWLQDTFKYLYDKSNG